MMALTRENLMSELEKKNFDVEAKDIVKNGVTCHGIEIKKTDGDIAPIIYTDDLFSDANKKGYGMDSVVRMVTDFVISFGKDDKKNFNVKLLYDRNWVLNHLYISAQRDSNQPYVKKKSICKGIEVFLYLNISRDGDEYGSINDVTEILQITGIIEDEAWKQAEKNMRDDMVIEDMGTMLGLDLEEPMLYVLTNKVHMRGAGMIADQTILADFARTHNTHCIAVFPSSVHEVLLFPDAEMEDFSAYSMVVQSVNEACVDEKERLSDRAYVFYL